MRVKGVIKYASPYIVRMCGIQVDLDPWIAGNWGQRLMVISCKGLVQELRGNRNACLAWIDTAATFDLTPINH